MSLISKPTVLITGCSAGGIGHALAKVFQERGYHVFATIRDPSKATDLSTVPDIDILELDVTNPTEIAHIKNLISRQTGGKLDILINNAGIEFQSPLIETNLSEAKHLYDVNVWGTLAMVQAFAPLVIKAKGIIANQSSIDAALSMAWAGIFASSKSAVARLSETLKVELAPLGVRVVTMMTGSTDTPMFDKPGGRMELTEKSCYYKVQEAAFRERMEHRKGATKIDDLAKQLVDGILGGATGQIWYGHLAALVRYLTWVAPTWVVDRVVNAERGVQYARVD